MKKLSFILALLMVVSSFMALTITNVGAVAETNTEYVMFDLRHYEDGVVDIPFGKGKNGDCYYPIVAGVDQVFPEVYTWGGATITPADDGAVITAKAVGGACMTEFDKTPQFIMVAINHETMKHLVIRIKANAAAKDVNIGVVSQGNKYKKVFPVEFTGEWQTLAFDLSGKGWTEKATVTEEVTDEKTGEKKTVNKTVYNPIDSAVWDEGKFSKGGFRVDFPSLGEEVQASFTIDYFAYMVDPTVKLMTGKPYKHEKYINGYAGKLFKPNATMTRAEACTIVTRLIADENNLGELKTSFTDVAENAWYFKYVAYLESKGYLGSYSGTFEPNKPITRAEFVELAYNMGLAKEDAANKKTFTDVPETHSRYNAIMAAASANLVGGYADGTFLPDRTITRAQVVTVINRALGRKSNVASFGSFKVQLFNDVAPDFWGFADIAEASLAHDCRFGDDGNEVWYSIYEEADYEATKAKIAEVDVAAEKLKNEILNSKTNVLVFGTSYYVSNNGNDSNDGKSPEKAWKSLSKVNSAALQEGDAVFFERGGLWRGQISAKRGVTYSAYGEGEKPKLYGSLYNGTGAENWTLVEGTTNIWKFKTGMIDTGTVVFNDGEAHSIKEIPSWKNGKYVARNDDSKEFNFKTDIANDLGIFCDNKGYESSINPLYMRCDKGNPGELYESIEFLPRTNGIRATDFVTIDNLCIKYVGSHGVGAGTVEGLIVQNCEFGWIGGGIQSFKNGMATRYGNAIEIYGGCKDYLVENNYIWQVYDAGATHQLSLGGTNACIQEDATYRNNLFEYCIYSIEYFLGKPDDASTTRYQEDILIENNIMRYAGFGFGEQRPDTGSAAHIKGWDHYNRTTKNFVIRNNVFDRSRHMLIHCGVHDKAWLPTFENNVWIQYITGDKHATPKLGRYGVAPTTNHPYDLAVRQTMKNIGLEEEPELYFAQDDWLWDLPIG